MGVNPVLISKVALPSFPGEVTQIGRAYGCAPALLLSELAANTCAPSLVVVPSVAEAESLATQLQFFTDGDPAIALFPDLETLPYDSFSPHQELISQRLTMLRKLAKGDIHSLLIAVPTLFYRLPPKDYIQGHSIRLSTGQKLSLEMLRQHLVGTGYQQVSQVEQHGEYAVRGSLLDVFPMGSESPVRLDFFDDELETIRSFDPDTQTSIGRLDHLATLPAREFPQTETAIKSFRRNFRTRFDGNPNDSSIYREVSKHRLPGGIENYLPLFFQSTATIWDYLDKEALVVSIHDTETALKQSWQQIQQRHEQACLDTDRPALKPEELFCNLDIHAQNLRNHRRLILRRHEIPKGPNEDKITNLNVAAAPHVLISPHAQQPVQRLLDFLDGYGGRLLFVTESPGRREMLSDMLGNREIGMTTINRWTDFVSGQQPIGITVAPLNQGLLITNPELGLIAEQDLYGNRPARRRRRRRARHPEAILNDLTDLHSGSAVVHENYGVGRYKGLSVLSIGEIPTEFLTLEYAGGDLLHVPVSSLHLVSRYTGASPENAPLHRLGTDQWTRIRRKAAEKIRDVAAELLELYAQRAAKSGESFKIDPVEYEQFAAGFAFELTEDQASAVNDVIKDLTSNKMMDRLICGDVGFGKTEVALRAAFTVVADGHQVALLAPTTLLAQQHFQTFCDRFADWPVNVEVLSRFRSARETTTVLDRLKQGKIDIVIGTHKLLQRNVAFKNLGLIIVDEEHRFGVRQKERLKNMRFAVDVLTLTATPIPRTLNMAMGELRDLSLIATPPESRLSIKTFVTGWAPPILREALQRELKRGGQVYFVHNRIEDIEQTAEMVAELAPEAKIRIAHGQLGGRELEQTMLDFYRRRFHILVCTAIIESGLDVPSANTIIINGADRFGLAQLHQLRGRVGRSHHQAYAYLIAPPQGIMTPDAEKRLAAIESMEDLGAGFVLATHDLEIRGAGELLGEEQTGQIQAIGFALYSELLARAVDAIRTGSIPDLETASGHGLEVNLHLPALLPEDYLPDVHLRLIHYKRIANAADAEALEELQIELVDRFGPLPPAAKNLFRITQIKLRAAAIRIRKIEANSTGGHIEFERDTRIDPRFLVKLVQSKPGLFSLDRKQRLRFVQPMGEAEIRLEIAERLTRQLAEHVSDKKLPGESA